MVAHDMSSTIDLCPICGDFERVEILRQDYGEWLNVGCARCGKFKISETATRQLQENHRTHQARLSAWTREMTEDGMEPPEISREHLPSIVGRLPDRSVVDKQRIILQAIERRTTNLSTKVSLIPSTDYPLAWASDPDELSYLLDALQARSLITITNRTSDRIVEQCQITPAGWAHLDSLQTARADTDQAFVAMSFDPKLDAVWTEAIRPTLTRLGYRPYRVDNDPSNLERIDAKIQAEIQRSRFLLADVTDQRQGVYFEAGYAMGLRIPVIWSVRKEQLAKVHFDTRQFPHIVWADEEELASELESRVMAGIGTPERTTRSV